MSNQRMLYHCGVNKQSAMVDNPLGIDFFVSHSDLKTEGPRVNFVFMLEALFENLHVLPLSFITL